MKLLVISDIHANWPALQAIREEADAVVCLGDIVSYGPFPQECVAWVREHATHVVRGNHDTALAYDVEATVAGLRQLSLGEVETEALGTILRTGKPVFATAGGNEGDRGAR